MNISEPSRQIIANVDYFKSPTCSGLKYVALQVALFFCKLFHFFKTGEWLNDPKLLQKVEQRIYTIKSGALRESFSDEEKDELTRVLNEMLIRVNQPPHKYVKPFTKIEKKDSKNTSTENEIKIDNKPSTTTKVAILELYPSEFIWSDDEEYNKTIFNRWGYDSEITLFDGTPISSIFKHGDYLIYVEIIYREINGEINKVKTILPSYLLLHDGPENEDCFKLKKKDQILDIKYPKFEVLRQAEYIIYEQLSFGSRKGAFSSKPIEMIYSDTYENRFSSEEPQFPMPTTLHKKNLTARPLIELSANISLYEFLNIHKSIENRIDFCINFEGKKQDLSKLNEVPNLTKYEKEAEFMFNPKSGFLISLPGSLKINISLFDDFMYVFSEKEKLFGPPKPNEIIVRQQIERANSHGIIFDSRKGLYKRDSIDLDNIKYVMKTGQLIIPLKNKQTTVEEKKNQQELLD